jgi:hypothetical protein
MTQANHFHEIANTSHLTKKEKLQFNNYHANGVRLEFLAETGTPPMRQPQSCYTQIIGSFNRKATGAKSTRCMARTIRRQKYF